VKKIAARAGRQSKLRPGKNRLVFSQDRTVQAHIERALAKEIDYLSAWPAAGQQSRDQDVGADDNFHFALAAGHELCR
jgi:hypothetical protein